jgi:hypothetical protein
LVALCDALKPEGVKFRVVANALRLDVLGHGLVHVPLTQLGVRPAGPVAHEFMGTAPRDTRKDEIPDRVLQDRPVTDFEDVLEVSLVTAGPGSNK